MQRTQQITYLPCSVPEHEGEMLNLVCIGCQESGLICSLCRQDHRNHLVVPLKILIHNLINKVAQDPSDEQYGIKMQQLQNLKHSLLYKLKLCVESLADQFQRVEQEIVDKYNQMKMQIIEQIHLGTEIDQLVNGVVAGTISQEKYKEDMKKLAKYIRPKEKQFVLSMDFERIMNPFAQIQRYLPAKLKDIDAYVQNNLKLVEGKESKSFLAPLFQEPILQNYKYRFSETLKASAITISHNKTTATQTQTQSGRFALIEEGMGIKNRKIKFRIVTLKNWVGVGICLKNKIVSANYQFKYEVLGHGSFLLSNNGYSWSHCYAEDNIHACLFTFKQDNIVEVTLEPNQMVFKIDDSPNTFKLKIEYKPEEWPYVCFCANLCSQGDVIEIVD